MGKKTVIWEHSGLFFSLSPDCIKLVLSTLPTSISKPGFKSFSNYFLCFSVCFVLPTVQGVWTFANLLVPLCQASTAKVCIWNSFWTQVSVSYNNLLFTIVPLVLKAIWITIMSLWACGSCLGGPPVRSEWNNVYTSTLTDELRNQLIFFKTNNFCFVS